MYFKITILLLFICQVNTAEPLKKNEYYPTTDEYHWKDFSQHFSSIPIDINFPPKNILRKTGQKQSYRPFDDGYYLNGVSPSFTRDASSNTVTDNLSKLIWRDDMYTAHPYYKTWEDAKNYCSSLNPKINNFIDSISLNRWRLPTRKELETILDYGIEYPETHSLHNTIFKYKEPAYFWTATEFNNNYAWATSFFVATEYPYKKTDGNYVRCVRLKTKYKNNITRY